MNETMQQALNAQLNRELYASYLYLAMAAHFEDKGLEGMGSWMRAQSEEERMHAMRIYDHILHRGGRVQLQALEAPPVTFGTPLETFRGALDHERKVTDMINELYDQAAEEHDHAAQIMLQWFVEEQVEEEDTASTIVDQLEMVGDDKPSLLMLDDRLGQRGGGEEM